jgi:glycosyltransferase involved in cell wall biosynthesis
MLGMNESVFIPAHNEEDTIENTRQYLLDQSFPHWEVINVLHINLSM